MCIFALTARRHASAVCRSHCVCSSVTSRCSTETAKPRTTQTTPHDGPWILVFCCRRSRQNSNGVIPNGGAKCRWGRLKLATFHKCLALMHDHAHSRANSQCIIPRNACTVNRDGLHGASCPRQSKLLGLHYRQRPENNELLRVGY